MNMWKGPIRPTIKTWVLSELFSKLPRQSSSLPPCQSSPDVEAGLLNSNRSRMSLYCVLLRARKSKIAIGLGANSQEVHTMDVDESALRESLDKPFGNVGWRMEKRGNRIIGWAPRKLKATYERIRQKELEDMEMSVREHSTDVGNDTRLAIAMGSIQ